MRNFSGTLPVQPENTADPFPGEVKFTADFYVLRPKVPAKGNGSIFMEISNRGGKAMISRLNQAERSIDPTEPAHFGDGFLLNRGFTLVWVGWQFDVRDAEGLVRLYPPVASGKTGLVRSDFTLPKPTELQPIGWVYGTVIQFGVEIRP